MIRFNDKEVEEDVEAVARAIAKTLDLPYDFRKRKATDRLRQDEYESDKQATEVRTCTRSINGQRLCFGGPDFSIQVLTRQWTPPRKLASSFPTLPREGEMCRLDLCRHQCPEGE